MTASEIRYAISTFAKGANVKTEIERPVKLRAAYKGIPMFKRTTMTVRIGINNDHREPVKQARAEGRRPAENQGLKGKEWVEAPILLRSIKSGKMLIRMEPSSNERELSKPVFFIREAGKETEVEKDDYAHMMLASESAKKTYDGCFDVGIDRVKRLHNIKEGDPIPLPAIFYA